MNEAKKKGWMGLLVLAVILVLLLWPLIYFARDWGILWGMAFLGAISGFTVLYMRTKYFWEE
jgi:nicotinamide riboside transporter PnuC